MTSYEQVNDNFFALIERDWEFFNYYDIPEDEAIALAEKRARQLMEEAIRLIDTKCLPQIDFSQRNEEDTGFAFDLTTREAYLIPMVMFFIYLRRDIAKLKMYEVNYTASEIKVFDPSNARDSFLRMYTSVKDEVDQLIDDYKNTDRNTGRYLMFDPSKYDVE